MSDTFVSVERRDDGVAVVQLDRPKMNALSAALLEQLGDVAERLRTDPPGAVVIWGGPKVFAAGADIAEFTSGDAVIGPDQALAIAGNFRRALDAVAAIPCVTIAAVAGYALGGGCELALACDLRVAGDSARLGQPEILLGIIPGGGGTQRLARLVGATRAKDLILTGRQVGAEEALSMGLVNRVVPADGLFDAAMEVASGLAAGATVAQRLAKRAIDEGLAAPLPDGLQLEQRLFAESFGTEDAATGVRSFLEHGPGRANFAGR